MTPEEEKRFRDLNSAYTAKFGFPFIFCARLHSKEEILARFARRLDNNRESEMEEAWRQIQKIAELRLQDIVSE